MSDHTFKYKQVQISRSDIRPHIKWAVSLVILHMVTSIFLRALCGYVWVNILTLSPRGEQNKAVLAISTMHHDDNVEGDNQKPEIILHYNDTKSLVDNLDHRATLYTSRRKVNRWPVVLFGNCLDVGAVAALIIWLAQYPGWNFSAVNG